MIVLALMGNQSGLLRDARARLDAAGDETQDESRLAATPMIAHQATSANGAISAGSQSVMLN